MVGTVFLALAVVVALGSALRYLMPDLDVGALRVRINRLVLAVFLPALNFEVIYTASVGNEFWQVPALALGGLAVTLAAGALVYARLPIARPARGGLILAGAFGNVTYFGLPVLRGLFPAAVHQVTKTVILYEMTITPMHLVVGAAVASRFAAGERFSLRAALLQVVQLPLLWAIAAALALNLGGVAVPEFILRAAGILGEATSGLMILSLGMALRLDALRGAARQLGWLMPCLAIKLALSPLVVWLVGGVLGVREPYFHSAVVEAAMPTQLLVLVVADRFGLDVETLAPAVVVCTLFSFATLPLLHALLR